MSYKSVSRHSITPPVSTRSRPSPKPSRSPVHSSRDSGSPSSNASNKLNFTLYGAPAPFTALRHNTSKTVKTSRVAPTPPTTPVDKKFLSSEVVILKNTPKTQNGRITPLEVEETPQVPEETKPEYEEATIPGTASPKSPLGLLPSHRSVSPLDLSSLLEDDDDDDVVESDTRKSKTQISNDLSKSTSIDLISGRSASSSCSSIAPISACSTQTCTSLPRDDSTLRSHVADVTRQNGDESKRSELPFVLEGHAERGSYENSSVGSGSSPGHRRYMLERLESGYYSPDTVDVRFSVSEVLEAAEYANRLAELLDQALGRELGYENEDGEPPRSMSLTPNLIRNGEYRDSTNPASLYEDERNQFFENVGGHPVFQNVINKIELFESGNRVQRSKENGRVTRYFRGGVSVDRGEVEVPLPPPLPYEGFKTVHDERCFCCGPRLLHFSSDDLQRQRSLLKKVPVKEKEKKPDDPAVMNLQEILKNAISKRRDVVRPIEEPSNSVRSDWSENESYPQVDK